MVLTDVLFSLLFLMALSALFRGLKSGHWGWFVCGGLATGLCWLTKYHGFFPLLIMGVWMAGRTGWDYFRGTNSKGHRVPWRAFALSTVGPVCSIYFRVRTNIKQHDDPLYRQRTDYYHTARRAPVLFQ